RTLAPAAAGADRVGQDRARDRPPARPDRDAVRQAFRADPDRRAESLPRRATRGARVAGAQRPPAQPALRYAGARQTAALPLFRQRPESGEAGLRLLGREPPSRPLRAAGGAG